MISCDCDSDIISVSVPRFITCRTARISSCCGKEIKTGEGMYSVSFFDFTLNVPVTPGYLCEECGDMALNLLDLGFCFTYTGNIVQQWRDYCDND